MINKLHVLTLIFVLSILTPYTSVYAEDKNQGVAELDTTVVVSETEKIEYTEKDVQQYSIDDVVTSWDVSKELNESVIASLYIDGSLVVDGNGILDNEFIDKHLRSTQYYTDILQLIISPTVHFDATGYCSNLIHELPYCTVIDFSGCDFSELNSISGMVQNCVGAKTIRMRNCTFGDKASVNQLVYNCPYVRTIDMSGTSFGHIERFDTVFSTLPELLDIVANDVTVERIDNTRGMVYHCYNLDNIGFLPELCNKCVVIQGALLECDLTNLSQVLVEDIDISWPDDTVIINQIVKDCTLPKSIIFRNVQIDGKRVTIDGLFSVGRSSQGLSKITLDSIRIGERYLPTEITGTQLFMSKGSLDLIVTGVRMASEADKDFTCSLRLFDCPDGYGTGTNLRNVVINESILRGNIIFYCGTSSGSDISIGGQSNSRFSITDSKVYGSSEYGVLPLITPFRGYVKEFSAEHVDLYNINSFASFQGSSIENATLKNVRYHNKPSVYSQLFEHLPPGCKNLCAEDIYIDGPFLQSGFTAGGGYMDSMVLRNIDTNIEIDNYENNSLAEFYDLSYLLNNCTVKTVDIDNITLRGPGRLSYMFNNASIENLSIKNVEIESYGCTDIEMYGMFYSTLLQNSAILRDINIHMSEAEDESARYGGLYMSRLFASAQCQKSIIFDNINIGNESRFPIGLDSAFNLFKDYDTFTLDFTNTSIKGTVNCENMFSSAQSLKTILFPTEDMCIVNSKWMFNQCPFLSTLQLPSNKSGAWADYMNMFMYCPLLTDVNLSEWNAENLTSSSALGALSPQFHISTPYSIPEGVNMSLKSVTAQYGDDINLYYWHNNPDYAPNTETVKFYQEVTDDGAILTVFPHQIKSSVQLHYSPISTLCYTLPEDAVSVKKCYKYADHEEYDVVFRMPELLEDVPSPDWNNLHFEIAGEDIGLTDSKSLRIASPRRTSKDELQLKQLQFTAYLLSDVDTGKTDRVDASELLQYRTKVSEGAEDFLDVHICGQRSPIVYAINIPETIPTEDVKPGDINVHVEVASNWLENNVYTNELSIYDIPEDIRTSVVNGSDITYVCIIDKPTDVESDVDEFTKRADYTVNLSAYVHESGKDYSTGVEYVVPDEIPFDLNISYQLSNEAVEEVLLKHDTYDLVASVEGDILTHTVPTTGLYSLYFGKPSPDPKPESKDDNGKKHSDNKHAVDSVQEYEYEDESSENSTPQEVTIPTQETSISVPETIVKKLIPQTGIDYLEHVQEYTDLDVYIVTLLCTAAVIVTIVTVLVLGIKRKRKSI